MPAVIPEETIEEMTEETTDVLPAMAEVETPIEEIPDPLSRRKSVLVKDIPGRKETDGKERRIQR